LGFSLVVVLVWWRQPAAFSDPPCDQFPLMVNAGAVHVRFVLVRALFSPFWWLLGIA